MSELWDVFVSYSSKDAKLVSRVVRDLEEAGLTVWWDRSSVSLAERIRETVNTGIRDCRTVAIFISIRSLQSRWVLNELDAAMLREIYEKKPVVIPILIGQVGTDELPADIQGKRYLDLRYDFESRYRTAKDELIAAIRKAARPTGEDTVRRIPVGDELVNFYLNYQPKADLPASNLNALYSAIVSSLLSLDDPSEPPEERRLELEEFIQRYGLLTLEKMAAFKLDAAGPPWDEEDLVDAIQSIVIQIKIFAEQWQLDGMKLFEVGVSDNGDFGFRTSPEVEVEQLPGGGMHVRAPIRHRPWNRQNEG